MKKTSQLNANKGDIQNPNRWKALALLALAQFLIILDTSIITGSYQFPEQTYRWTESKGVAL
jgi:hypothetical protein